MTFDVLIDIIDRLSKDTLTQSIKGALEKLPFIKRNVYDVSRHCQPIPLSDEKIRNWCWFERWI